MSTLPRDSVQAFRRVLVVRSAQMSRLQEFLLALQCCHPDCSVGVLTNPQFAAQCAEHPFVRWVEEYRGGRSFSARGVRGRTAAGIRRCGYEAVVVLLCNADGGGYENVYGMLSAFGIPKQFTFSVDSRFQPLLYSRKSWKQTSSDLAWLFQVSCALVRAWLSAPLERRRFIQRAARLNRFLLSPDIELPPDIEPIPAPTEVVAHEDCSCALPVLER
jgi:hypothetical protein